MHPVRVGLASALALVIAFVVTEAVLGRFPNVPPGERTDAWIAVVHCLMIGGLVGANLVAVRLGRQSLDHLRANFPDAPAGHFDYPPLSTRRRVLSALLGLIIVGVLSPFLTAPFPWLPSMWTPEVTWHRILGLLIGILGGLALYVGVRESVIASRAASRLPRVDLFSPDRFQPLVRHGLTNMLITVGLTAIGGLFLVDLDQWRVIVPIWGLALPLMIFISVLPVWGASRRLRRAKQAELQGVLQRIRGAREADPPDSSTLGELASYYRLVEDFPASPITYSYILKALLFLLIPLASWLAAVIAEVMLEATLF